jgi:hypothetical protein
MINDKLYHKTLVSEYLITSIKNNFEAFISPSSKIHQLFLSEINAFSTA